MKKLITFLLATTPAYSAVSVTSPTTSWDALIYTNTETSGDQQTGTREGDIVGTAADASFYVAFDGGDNTSLTDGEIGFRIRVAGDKNPSGFDSVFWVGIDANLDGTIDLFAGANEDSTVGIYAAGSDANNSPITTSIDTATPYYEVTSTMQNSAFQEITASLDPGFTSLNIDGGSGGGGSHTDHFVSFVLPFEQVILALNSLSIGTFDQNSAFQYVAATSNNQNAINQDINGVNGELSSTSTWTDLGGFSDPVIVPEPSALMLSLFGFLLIFNRRRD